MALNKNRIGFIVAVILFIICVAAGIIVWNGIIHGAGIVRSPSDTYASEKMKAMAMLLLFVITASRFVSFRRTTKETVVKGSTDDALRLLSGFMLFFLAIAMLAFIGLFVVLSL